jgi:hypothetical protein
LCIDADVLYAAQPDAQLLGNVYFSCLYRHGGYFVLTRLCSSCWLGRTAVDRTNLSFARWAAELHCQQAFICVFLLHRPADNPQHARLLHSRLARVSSMYLTTSDLSHSMLHALPSNFHPPALLLLLLLLPNPLCYSIQLSQDLNLSSSVYGLGSGAFFLAYALGQLPSNFLLLRFGGPAWLSAITIVWGLAASVRHHEQMHACLPFWACACCCLAVCDHNRVGPRCIGEAS